MKSEEILITGANGEVGHGLIKRLSAQGNASIVAIDIEPIDQELQKKCTAFYQGDLLDDNIISTVTETHTFSTVFHLAGLLSTGCERNPIKGHDINVNGALVALDLARRDSEILGQPVKFFFPSTIAVYGVANKSDSPVIESENLDSITMYGCNKLYVERVGRYFARHYKLLDSTACARIDFRALRFPGLFSTETLPSSGTSDYFSEMVHAAAKGTPYSCFVRPDTKIPFMIMPDAIDALLDLMSAPKEKLSTDVYNVSSFAISAEEIRAEVLNRFPGAEITFEHDNKRQRIVDSWPSDMNDSCARKDWGWKPRFDRRRSFEEYIFPGVIKRYQGAEGKKVINS